jgi:hypothetical protein
MARFLSTQDLTQALHALISNSKKHLVLISPVVRLNTELRALLASKTQQEVEVRIVCGDKRLSPDDHHWFKQHPAIQLRHVAGLQARCYINDNATIITSLGLDDFGHHQLAEMGVLATLKDDPELYKNTIKEVGRILRQGDQVVSEQELTNPQSDTAERLTIPQLAKAHHLSTAEIIAQLLKKGYMTEYEGMFILTNAGKDAGARLVASSHGIAFAWPPDILQHTR